MKPKDYVSKDKLDRNGRVKFNPFLEEFTLDFLNLLETARKQSNWIYSTYKRTVNDMRKKFDAINRRLDGNLDEAIWKKFYATVVQEQKELHFGDYLKKKQKEHEGHQARHRERMAYNDFSFGSMFEDAILRLRMAQYKKAQEDFFKYLFQDFKAEDAFKAISLPITASLAIVEQHCKALLIKFHPDRIKDVDEKARGEEKFKEVANARDVLRNHFKGKE